LGSKLRPDNNQILIKKCSFLLRKTIKQSKIMLRKKLSNNTLYLGFFARVLDNQRLEKALCSYSKKTSEIKKAI
jgi:hypothetical protein